MGRAQRDNSGSRAAPQERECPFFGGGSPSAKDFELAPQLHHIEVTCKAFKASPRLRPAGRCARRKGAAVNPRLPALIAQPLPASGISSPTRAPHAFPAVQHFDAWHLFPHLDRYIARMKARPSWQRTRCAGGDEALVSAWRRRVASGALQGWGALH